MRRNTRKDREKYIYIEEKYKGRIEEKCILRRNARKWLRKRKNDEDDWE